jgi:hypothetical protein
VVLHPVYVIKHVVVWKYQHDESAKTVHNVTTFLFVQVRLTLCLDGLMNWCSFFPKESQRMWILALHPHHQIKCKPSCCCRPINLLGATFELQTAILWVSNYNPNPEDNKCMKNKPLEKKQHKFTELWSCIFA